MANLQLPSLQTIKLSLRSADQEQDIEPKKRARRPSTENLEPHSNLASDPRGFDEDLWINPDITTRMNKAPEYCQVLPSQHQSSSPSSASSPRGVFSSSSTTNGSIGSLTSYSSVGSGPNSYDSRHDSPEVSSGTRHPGYHPAYGQPPHYGYAPQSSHTYHNMMNATQSYGAPHHHGYLGSHPPHMGHAGHVPSTAPPPYSHYPQPASVLQPSMSYADPGHAYPIHPYSHPVASTQPTQHSQYPHQPMLPAMNPPPAGATGPGGQEYQQPHTLDTSGQVAPPGMKPKVTATLWEDEGTLCFQVEVGGICVARREDNHMINGTKLLNVAGMTRGRRDGILKSEKTRNVVKIGPMHLKGVWIPFERALEFSNKEKMTERLYPLFVHNIRGLLQTQGPTTQGAVRRGDSQSAQAASSQYPRTSTATSQPPSLTHAQTLPVTTSQSVHTPIAQTGSNRPGLDRAHTFPTPPTSATSAVNVPSNATSYDWSGPAIPVTSQVSVDNANTNRTMPNTPATTPPDNSLTSMHHFQSNAAYDTSRPVFSAPPPHQSPYASSTAPPYGYAKSEMGPPARGGATEHSNKEESNEHEYANTNSYANDRYGTYSHGPGMNHAAPTPSPADRTLLSNDVKHSPQHGSVGRMNVRNNTIPSSQPPHQWPSSYNSTTQQQRGSTSNLAYVVSDNRSSGIAPTNTNGYMSESPQSSQSFAYPPNGTSAPSNKRMREVEDEHDPYMRPSSTGADAENSLKRRKTTREDSLGLPTLPNSTLNRPKATAHAPSRR